MKICVLNGSPKGKYSVTLQTALYIESRCPECQFEVIDAGRRIKAYEKDMSEALASIENADMILFTYPVYTFIAPYQLHRFIELLKRSGVSLKGKFAAQITTSKHFFDVTAHEYIRENCLDMGLNYIGGLSADMDDLLSKKGRAEALGFWNYALYCAKNGLFEAPVEREAENPRPYTASLRAADKKEDYDTVIVTNMEPGDESLGAMIADFQAAYTYQTRIVNIAQYPFKGGCLGCLNCAVDGKCVYKDGFDAFLHDKILSADAIVYALTIKDHSMGATFKLYDDRQFCNGHRTVTEGMPEGYIINGDIEREANLNMIINGRSEVGHTFLAGIATDSEGIKRLCGRLAYALENKLVLPRNFLGVGGMKIFRDLIYLMRGLMRADHNYYKRHGLYDFPQKKTGTILKMKLLGALVNNPKAKARMNDMMNEGMIAPYRKAIEEARRDCPERRGRV